MDALGDNPTPSHPADLELVRRALRGQEAATDQLIERLRCVPAILMSRNAKLGSPLGEHDLADLSQDTLIVIWKKLPVFAGRASLETWAYRVCCLEIMNTLRKQRRRPTLVEDLEGARPAETGAELPASSVDYEHVYLGLEQLGPPENEIVRLKHFEHLTFAEVGARLGISPNTAKTQYYRGLVRLRELLEPTEAPAAPASARPEARA